VTELSHDIGDDGFHEIQLSGKQLVFLFMATTVVSVVIFLCGVLVGRSVRDGSLRMAADAAAAPASGAGPIGQSPAASIANPPPAVANPPAPPTEAPLTYPDRLNREKPATEELKSVAEASKPQEPPKPQPAAAPASSSPPATAAQAANPGTWAVQVVALTDRAAATAVVQRLKGKGFPAFLVSPQPGAPMQNYKVQVGRYNDRSEAEEIKARLKKEEQFEPWILR
jgi:cell division septation protein DedD